MNNIKLPLDPLILSVGINEEPGPNPFDAGTVIPFGFQKLTDDLLRQLQPDTVVSWLFCKQYDVFDVANLLDRMNFVGEFIAVSGKLPRVNMIAREIKSRFPKLNFILMSPAQLSGAAKNYHCGINEPTTAPNKKEAAVLNLVDAT